MLTDTDSKMVQKYLYTPFGEDWVTTTNETASKALIDKINRKYGGQLKDGESGLYYMNARYYNPDLAIFMRPDPAMDGLNHYAYVSGNPIMYMDPTGLEMLAGPINSGPGGVVRGNGCPNAPTKTVGLGGVKNCGNGSNKSSFNFDSDNDDDDDEDGLGTDTFNKFLEQYGLDPINFPNENDLSSFTGTITEENGEIRVKFSFTFKQPIENGPLGITGYSGDFTVNIQNFSNNDVSRDNTQNIKPTVSIIPDRGGMTVTNDEVFIADLGLIIKGVVSSIVPLVRNVTVRNNFLKSIIKKSPRWMRNFIEKGKVPPGYNVHHINPLSAGGDDVVSNMSLKLTSDHQRWHKFYRPWKK